MKQLNQYTRALPAIQQILADAQKTIKDKTGFDVVLITRIKGVQEEELVERLLVDMCEKWGIKKILLQNFGREEPYADMRKVFWMCASIHYPSVSSKYKALLVGVTNHATALHGTKRGFELLSIQDEKFMAVYEPVKEFFL